jgi:hypothetical protein
VSKRMIASATISGATRKDKGNPGIENFFN